MGWGRDMRWHVRKFLILSILALGLGTAHAGWFGPGTAADYSQDAGNEFYCASTTTLTTQAGSSATSPIWSLTNPYGSNKKLVILDVGINVNASPAAAADFFLAYSSAIIPSTQTIATANGMRSAASIGVSTSTAVGICSLNLTLTNASAPIAFRYLGGTTGASAIGGVMLTDQTQGKVVIPPGWTVSIQATSAASITSHVLEREDPI